MSLLFPLFLTGLAALAIPLYLHLARRRPRREVAWSSTMFLSPSPPPRSGRRRWEDLLLLGLRCLVVGLLAVGFARPFIARAPAGAPAAGPTVVLIDASASMRREDLWKQAVARARAAVPGAGEAAVYTFDRRLAPLITFEEMRAISPVDRPARVGARLDERGPGWGGTDLGNALEEAAALLRNAAAPAGASDGGRVIVVSDLQDGAVLPDVGALGWPPGVALEVEAVRARADGNLGLHPALASGEELHERPPARVRVSHWAATGAGPRRYRVRTEEGSLLGEGELAPGQSRTLALDLPPLAPGGSHTLVLEGDEHPFDNRVWLAPPLRRPVHVVYVGKESAEDPRGAAFFLVKAFPPTAGWMPLLTVRRPDDPALPNDLAHAELVVVAEVPGADHEAILIAALERGATVLWVLDEAAAARSMSRLIPGAALRAEEAPPGRPVTLAHVDVRHHLLRAFAEARFADFTRIRFWRHRVIDEESPGVADAAVLARFSDGAPAWLVWPVGRGHLVAVASGWRPVESQLARSSKFVPFLHGLLGAATGPVGGAGVIFVGDPIALEPAKERTLVRPDGERVRLDPKAARFAATHEPGVYRVISSDEPQIFAVHVPAAESQTVPLSEARLRALAGSPQVAAATSAPLPAEDAWRAAAEDRQKGWRWVLGGLLALLVLETLVAGALTARSGRVIEEEAGT